MSTLIFHPAYEGEITEKAGQRSVTRFLSWSKQEQPNRIAWLCVSITVMTAIFFPLTMASILLHGATFALIISAMVSLIVVVVPNLAALPTKFTIPALFVGIGIDLSVIILSFLI